MRNWRFVEPATGVLGTCLLVAFVACERGIADGVGGSSAGAAAAAEGKPAARADDESAESEDGASSGETARDAGDDEKAEETAEKVSPGFVFGGHPHTEEVAHIRLHGAEDTEIPVRADARESAERVGEYEVRKDEAFEIQAAKTVIEGVTKESPVAFAILPSAEHVEGPGHDLPVEVERGEEISMARKYHGEGMSDAYIWYDGSVYVGNLDDFELSNPEVMESDAGFANRNPRAVPRRDGTVFEAIGSLGHQSFSKSSDSSSWWGRVEVADGEGWIRMDREEIRVERCFPTSREGGDDCAPVGVGAD